jgi:hypothetical protein
MQTRKKPPAAGTAPANDGKMGQATRGWAAHLVPSLETVTRPGWQRPGSSAHEADAKRQMITPYMFTVDSYGRGSSLKRSRNAMCSNVVGCTLAYDGRRSPPQHAVEFVDKQIGRLVGIVRCHRGTQIRSRNFDAPLGREHPLPMVNVGFHVDADAENVGLVTEEPCSLRFEGCFHCFSELKMNAAENQIGAVFGRCD